MGGILPLCIPNSRYSLHSLFNYQRPMVVDSNFRFPAILSDRNRTRFERGPLRPKKPVNVESMEFSKTLQGLLSVCLAVCLACDYIIPQTREKSIFPFLLYVVGGGT